MIRQMRNHLSCFLWQKYIESDEKRKAKKECHIRTKINHPDMVTFCLISDLSAKLLFYSKKHI